MLAKNAKTNRIRQNSVADRVYLAITEVILWFMLIVILVPLIYVLSSSFSSPEAVGNGRVFLWPVDFSLKGYEAVFTTPKVWLGFRNSVFYTVAGTTINIAVTMLAAYPLSRRDLKGRGFVTALFTFTMLFSGGMIPTYLLVRDLKMIDTVWAMLLPGAMSVYNVIIARTYIQSSIPFELYESASLDGCTDDRYLIRIVLPLAKPIIAVLVLWYAVGHWNQYFNAMIYLRNPNLLPLQIVLRNFLIVEDMNGAAIANMTMDEYMDTLYLKNLYQYSLIVVASAPVMLLYPFIQKHFVSGIMLGSLKG
ncbi:MAG TPA: carbohydrate ABC transporter permease [Candidatus Faecaligallichristensenella faecipullorum]|nr:carbohydrate ABC transporter permease [Candidatus Faecaligallichristensenella faecipullorum]